MAVHHSFLLVLTGLTGIQSITTVSKVSVKAGDSISIPCLYSSQYRGHVKFLCRGYYWDSCSYAVKTNQQGSGKFSVSDDKEQRVFTVTVKDLTYDDTHYWCAVEINNEKDVSKYFQLSVTGDTPSLFADHQEITGFKGENININCYHRNSGEMKWCKLGSSCVTGSSGSIDGTRVSINTSAPNVFTVTMSALKADSGGWYWCVKGDLQMPVHVTIHGQLSSSTQTSVFESGALPVQDGPSSTSFIPVLMSRLTVLVFFIVLTSFICLKVKTHKHAKESSTTLTEQEVVIRYMSKTPDERPDEKSDVKEMSSSVVEATK